MLIVNKQDGFFHYKYIVNRNMKIFQRSEIEEAISSSTAFATKLIDEIERGFCAYSEGKFNACPIQTMGAPPMDKFPDSEDDSRYAAQVCVKSGYIGGDDYFVLKVASGGYPLPDNWGCMQVFSQRTGKLEALLLDDGILTEIRTAAAGALAAKVLAPKQIDCIGMVGTGIQARYQLQFLKEVTECRKLLIYGRTPEHVEDFSADCVNNGWMVEVAQSANELLDQCELIVTTTTSREAILGKDCYQTKTIKKQHITCIGADAPGKMELDVNLVASASLLVADSLLQTQERGEYEMAIKQGLVAVDDVIEIGKLVVDKREKPSIINEEGLSIFDSSGVAVQDCIIANMVYTSLMKS